MNKVIFFLSYMLISFSSLVCQPIIYDDNTTIISGTWNAEGILSEVSNNGPFEGSLHYDFDYNYTGFWAGIGLNLDNWGSGPTYDFSAYSHIRLAYRGMSGVQGLTIQLRSDNGAGNIINIGGPNATYQEVEVSLLSLFAGTSLDLTSITEINLSVTGSDANGSGNLYFDKIELINNNSGTVTSAATWQRVNAIHKGVNYSNWLEAYWLIPFGTYPESDKFTSSLTSDFSTLGFDAIRLPVTFENLAESTAPYTLDTEHPTFDLIDNAIQWAANNNMKLIIDMHHGEDLTDANFQTELPRLKAIWEQIIDLYGDLDPDRYLFEVYNEPHAISNANFRTVAQELVDVIRSAGATHSVVVGATGFNGATDLLSFTPLDDPDIIYTFHFYEPYSFTHQLLSFTNTFLPARNFPINDDIDVVTAMINGVGQWSDFYNAPVIVGEFGVSMNAAEADRCNWVTTVADLFENNALPWFYWGAIDLSNGFGFFDGGVVSVNTMEPCFGTALGLPTSFLAISDFDHVTLDCEKESKLLSWQLTSDELATAFIEGFEEATSQWREIGSLTIQPKYHNYTFQFNQQDRSSFYRLRIVELDGTIHYSKIIANNCESDQLWNFFPNPVIDEVLRIQSDIDGWADIVIHNTLGREIRHYQKVFFQSSQSVGLPLDGLSAGSYWVKITTDLQNITWKKVIVAR